MPVYTYRREDGTLFDVRQSFTDNALTVDPTTGQKVVRVVQNAGVIFKGSGFYVTDSKASGAGKSGSQPTAPAETPAKPAETPAPAAASAAD